VFAHYLSRDRKFYSSLFCLARNSIKKVDSFWKTREILNCCGKFVFTLCAVPRRFCLHHPSSLLREGSGRIQVSSASKEAHLSNVACYNLRDFPFFRRPLYWNGKYLHHGDESNGYFNNKVSRSCTHKLLLQYRGHLPKKIFGGAGPFPFPPVSLQAERRKNCKMYLRNFLFVSFFPPSFFSQTSFMYTLPILQASPTDNYVYILPFSKKGKKKQRQ
jgi:hypothetical protein